MRNRHQKREWIAFLPTDLTLNDAEVVRMYGMRWEIETFFKRAKSQLKLGQEFQSRNDDAMIAQTIIVFVRYLLLMWERRKANDSRTMGELFFWFADEVKDMVLKTALYFLTQFIAAFIKQESSSGDTVLFVGQLHPFIAGLPCHIQGLLPKLRCEVESISNRMGKILCF